jgi:hypothetical protein
MLSEHREAIWARALWVEILELWALARQPAHRIPSTIVRERQLEYFRWRLEEAITKLSVDGELLAGVLEEILLIAIGEDTIVNWQPPSIDETLIRIGEPLTPRT